MNRRTVLGSMVGTTAALLFGKKAIASKSVKPIILSMKSGSKRLDIPELSSSEWYSIYDNGMRQCESSDFTCSGDTIMFVDTPKKKDRILIDVLTQNGMMTYVVDFT